MSIPRRQDPFYQAQSILSRRDHSEAEVRFKMRKKGFSKEDVDKVIQWLKEKKFLNDEQFAQRYIESMVRSKAVGKIWIKHKLRQKGLNDELTQKTLEQFYTPEQEKAALEQAVATWRNRHKDEVDRDSLS